MSEKSHPVATVGASAKTASTVFAPGFYSGEALRQEHRAESSLRLAYTLHAAQVDPRLVHALALAVREVADAAPFEPQQRLSSIQLTRYEGLMNEKGLPAPFRDILQAALPRLTLRRDLTALYGVLSGTYERMLRLLAVTALARQEPV